MSERASFMNLDVWKAAHQLTLNLYPALKAMPDDERLGLTIQMKRAAVSVEANIAEGSAKLSVRDRRRHYVISRGSAEELRCLMIIAKDLGYMRTLEPMCGLLDRVCAMLYRLVAPPSGSGLRSPGSGL
jgi:four helix bundle protein